MKRLRILELRSVVGSGGGPEKTILLGTARTDPREFAITVCYIRDVRDERHDLADRARALGLDYVEIPERHSFDWRVWPALKALCRSRSIDLVHSHDYKTDLLAWMLSHSLGIRTLATAHGWVGHTWRERSIYYPADKWLLSRFPRVIAVSGQIKQELIRTGTTAERVDVILNGIDPERFHRQPSLQPEVRRELGLPRDAVVLGAVGRLEPQKRFDLLVDAFVLLRQTFPALHVVIAGDGSLSERLKIYVQQRGVGDRCRLIGHCGDVPRLHHAFDLFVQSSDYEGTPNAVLEAMAMGTPLVATDAGGTAELVLNDVDGLLVPCGSAERLAGAIASLLIDSGLRERLSKAARTRIEGPLSFDARMRSVERVYRELFLSLRVQEARA